MLQRNFGLVLLIILGVFWSPSSAFAKDRDPSEWVALVPEISDHHAASSWHCGRLATVLNGLSGLVADNQSAYWREISRSDRQEIRVVAEAALEILKGTELPKLAAQTLANGGRCESCWAARVVARASAGDWSPPSQSDRNLIVDIVEVQQADGRLRQGKIDQKSIEVKGRFGQVWVGSVVSGRARFLLLKSENGGWTLVCQNGYNIA